MRKAIVIGAGFGGLSVAAYLAKDGFRVTVLEKNDETGGRARYWESGGYRFDMGPSWYLMPEVFDRFFGDFGRTTADYYELKRLDPSYKVFFSTDEDVTITPDLGKTAALFDSFEPGGGQKLRNYLQLSQYKYDVAMRDFLYKDYRKAGDFLNRRLLIEGSRLKIFQSLDKNVSRYFSDRRAKQILEYAMVFLGTSPRDAPGLYSILAHVDLNLGVYYPSGGLAGVALGFRKHAESLGVEVITGADVSKIATQNGKAVAVESSAGSFDADVVVSGADYAHTEIDLLDRDARSFGENYWKKKVFAPSMFIMFLGINKRLDNLEHHNLYFSEDWDRHFDTIFKTPSWPEEPCFYVSCISKTDADAAPAGSENVFVLVPVAPGLGDTDEVRQMYYEKTLDHLESVTGERVRDSIEVSRIYTHRDFNADYNAYGGTALGLSHTLRQTAFFRPSHRSKKIGNLFYTGQYTHPGVGVPMTLVASSVAANLIRETAE
jgi:1-hydroxy-2-isopentenylcarotenoid 3,4-desaturase